MPTARVTANTTAQDLFETPRHDKGILSALEVDNQSGGARTVWLQDVFTPDTSVGQTSPSEQTLTRSTITVGDGLTGIISAEELEDAEFLGTAKAIADSLITSCVITARYHFK